MAYTKYSLTPANNTAAPPDGAPEGMLPSAVNDTMRDMMAQIRDVGDGVRDGTYTMTTPKITGGTITGVTLTGNTLTNPVITGATLTTSAFNGTVGATTASTGAFTTLSTSSTTTLSGLTASTALALDASKNVVSVTNTGTGNNVLSASPTLTGTIAGASLSLSSLTSGRVTYAGASGLLSDSATFVFDGTNLGLGTSSPVSNAGYSALTISNTTGGQIYWKDTNTSVTAYAGADNSVAYLATSSNHPFLFRTNSVERMRITAAGLVGIGTSSPSAKLEISGATDTIKTYGSSYNQQIYDAVTGAFSQGVWQVNAVSYALVGAGGGNMVINTAGNSTANIIFSTGSGTTERMRILANGNVVVGGTTDYGRFTVRGYKTYSTYGNVSATFSDDITSTLYVSHPSGGVHVTSDAALMFGSGTSALERMRLDTSGNLLVGTTSAVTTTIGSRLMSGATDPYISSTLTASSDATTSYLLYSTGAAAYRFYVGLGGTIFATSIVISAISDQRLKENIRDIDTGLSTIMALKPRRFDWKEGKGQDKKNVAGFIAQEFEDVFPECVNTAKAGEDGIEYKNINHETLIPTLVKAIQEQQALIESLTTRLTALENK